MVRIAGRTVSQIERGFAELEKKDKEQREFYRPRQRDVAEAVAPASTSRHR
jgi:hypothetical protein